MKKVMIFLAIIFICWFAIRGYLLRDTSSDFTDSQVSDYSSVYNQIDN